MRYWRFHLGRGYGADPGSGAPLPSRCWCCAGSTIPTLPFAFRRRRGLPSIVLAGVLIRAVAAGRVGVGPGRARLAGLGERGGTGAFPRRSAPGWSAGGGGGGGGFHRAGAVVGREELALSRCSAGRVELGHLDAGVPQLAGPAWTTLAPGWRRPDRAGPGAGLPGERAAGRAAAPARGLWLLYLPLLVPQIGFLFGPRWC